MTDEQARIIGQLSHCTLAPYHKRFVRDMDGKSVDYVLSPRQDWHLRRLYYHYRRQVHLPDMPKPDNYDDPPAIPNKHKTAQEQSSEVERSVSFKKAAELARLIAWNEGKPYAP